MKLKLDGIKLITNHFDYLLSKSEANVYWKDLDGRYLDANDWQVQRCGARDHQNLMNHTDFDFNWKACASHLIKNDIEIIAQNHASIYLEPTQLTKYNNFGALYLSYKSPLFNKYGKTIGVYGFSYLLEDESSESRAKDELSSFLDKNSINTIKEILYKYQLSKKILSKRKIDCINGIMQGLTINEIADVLDLSPRTVENYLGSI